jgi:hypothetical protein
MGRLRKGLLFNRAKHAGLELALAESLDCGRIEQTISGRLQYVDSFHSSARFLHPHFEKTISRNAAQTFLFWICYLQLLYRQLVDLFRCEGYPGRSRSCSTRKQNNGNRNQSARHCARSYHFVIAVWSAKEHNPSRKLLEYHR